MWVVLRYTEVLMEPPSSLVKRMSKKGSCSSDSFSTVNWMLLSMLLRWLWKELTRLQGKQYKCHQRNVSRNVEEYGKLTVSSV